MESGRDLNINDLNDDEITQKLVPAKEDKCKDSSEAFFVVAKMMEYLHIERGISAEDLFYFLQHPKEKKADFVAKEIKKYFKQQPESVETNQQKQEINAAFKDLTRWTGSYREFVDFIEETQTLKECVDKMLSQKKQIANNQNQKKGK